MTARASSWPQHETLARPSGPVRLWCGLWLVPRLRSTTFVRGEQMGRVLPVGALQRSGLARLVVRRP